jgi:hypothetical protein
MKELVLAGNYVAAETELNVEEAGRDVNNSGHELNNACRDIHDDQNDCDKQNIHDDPAIHDNENEDVVVERSSSSRLTPPTNPKTKSKPKNERGRGRDTRRRLFAILKYATKFSLCVLTVVAFFVSILKSVNRLLIVRSSEYIFILYSHI